MLRVQDMCFSFGTLPVLEEVSFAVEPGCLCGLFGPNGCGKTTLFRCCLGFLKNGRGSVFLDGRDTKRMKIREMAKTAAYVPPGAQAALPLPGARGGAHGPHSPHGRDLRGPAGKTS